MPGPRQVIPDSANRFFDPRTGRGISLESVAPPRVHECGFMVLGEEWNYAGVCSPFWRAYVNLDAGAAVAVAGERVELQPGRVIIIPEEVVYSCHPKMGVRHLWIHFSMPEGPRADGPVEIELPAYRAEEWRELASLIRIGATGLAPLCTALLLQAMAGMPGASGPGRSIEWAEFTRWADTRLATPPSIAEMAAFRKMSERAFFRWFQAVSESSPAAWFLRRRVREVCRRLRFSAASIEEIAATTGFANRHHLSRAFRAETGLTPAAYRSG